METGQELRERMLDWRRESASRHYPEAILRDVVAYAQERVSAGVSRHAISLELDIPQTTLNRWLNKSRTDGVENDDKTALVAVRVADDVSRSHGYNPAVVMTSPRGWRVEVRRVDEAITMLRALS